VFVPHEGDHYRTRLTHSIEVGQLARALSRSLGLDEDLAEAIALAHDLGHTPFGHTGEDMLDELMAAHGGFDHNAQTLRIVTKLERRYAAFDGLNLTFETIEGLAKHNGPLVTPSGGPVKGEALSGVFLELDAQRPLGLDCYASAEAQSAALADDIAYDAHDIDDGLRAGLLELDDCRCVPFLATLLDEVGRTYPGLDNSRRIHELTRRLITRFVEDAIAESSRRLDGLRSLDEVRGQHRAVIAFSPAMSEAEAAIKVFLFSRIYRQRDMMRVREGAAAIVRELFLYFMAHPEAMPPEWQAQTQAAASAGDLSRQARLVCDYIAGMTDRYALAEHHRYFDATPELRYGARQ
jgi:dGTPase